jgi:DNA-binding MarR family transcriptional regulator
VDERSAKVRKGLETCVCFNLRRAARLLTQRFDAALRPAGLRMTQFSLLALLAAGGDTPMLKLASSAGMDRTTLTRNLRFLTKRKWANVRRGQDNRERWVSLSDQGWNALMAAIPRWRAANEAWARHLGRSRTTALLGDLAHLVEAIR